MNFEVSSVLGWLGIMLAIVEVWRPKLSVMLEDYIGKQVSEVNDFQTLFLNEYKVLSEVANSSIKEALKGPQLMTMEELKRSTYTSIANIKSYLWFYFVTLVNVMVLKPIRLLLVFLNRIGRGRAVGGLGIIMAILSTIL
ncbi:hypothetical protein ACXRSW_01915 [Aeromonas dhakensis]|uniref:hypothetical protein n=1 Tax=Aeromonas dhakensis TaxID=196024 RepID=UPI0020B29BE3|nr:hypothetical protein [Aeromonas dhakensis]WPS57533.1 hypothetical protein RDV79_02490 [Aeromonas dhakensis]WRT75053.1 hypothetical protein VK677_10440 [Aeromonas dhakensis]CAD7491110.1 hypothetical protein KBAD45_18730 [Aeromonas dhakensis]CAD7509347.1 hypothetical protein KBAD59_22710 [Aeromonas dhakensis]CAD7510909.1 hypothetical protein KBAD11_23140 [Aeromonas dhakensis]